MWVLFIRCFDSKFKQEYVFDMIDVFYLTVKSTSPMRKICLGSVQEAENVISPLWPRIALFLA